jgi:hypothetical protein
MKTDYDPEAVKDAEELELEATIKRLVDRLDDARKGSAEYKMIIRQLQGMRDGSQLGRLIMEEYAMRGEVSVL